MGSLNAFVLVILSTTLVSKSFAADHDDDHRGPTKNAQAAQPAAVPPQPFLPVIPPELIPPGPEEGNPNTTQMGNGPRTRARPVTKEEELGRILDRELEAKIFLLEEKLKKNLHDLIVKMRGIPVSKLDALKLEGVDELKALDRVLQTKGSISKQNGKLLTSSEKVKVLLKAWLLTKFANNLINEGVVADEADNQAVRGQAWDAAKLDYQDAERDVNSRSIGSLPRPAPAREAAIAGLKGIEEEAKPVTPMALPGQEPFQPAQNAPSGGQDPGPFPEPQGNPPLQQPVPSTVGKYLAGQEQGPRGPLGTNGARITPRPRPRPKTKGPALQ